MSLPPGIPPGTDLWAVPAGKPPLGSDIQPNLIDPPSSKAIPQVTLSIFIALATIFVGLRVYVQLFITRSSLKWDDVCLLAALPMQIAYTAVIMWMAEYGLIARHVWDIPLAIPILKLPHWTRVVNSLPQPITGFVKAALLFFYLRLFGINPTLRVLIILGLVFVGVVYTAFTITFAVLPSVNNPVVIKLSIVQAAVNIFTDVFLFVLPLFGIANLKIATKRKILLLGVFSTGLAAVVMSCLTLYWRDTTKRGKNSDSTWQAATIFTISLVEIDIGILCACMPLLAPLLPKISGIARGLSTFIRSQILRTRSKTQASDTDISNGQYDATSDRESSQKRSDYIELSERESTMQQTSKSSKKNWFDRSIMAVSNAAPDDDDAPLKENGASQRV